MNFLSRVLHKKQRFLELVEALVRLETPSLEPPTQGPALELLASRLEPLGLRPRRSPRGILFAREGRRRPAQMLVGHCDTVWPTGTLRQMPFRVEDDTVSGPGIYDMKAGLAMIVVALEVLQELDRAPALDPVVVVNSDEEIGSRRSTGLIARVAKGCRRALVLEPSLGPEGRLKTARKGVGGFVVTVKGRAAHAGLEPGKGASAILELSHLIQQLFALNDAERGVTVNVGMVDGGLRPNVVAPTSQARVDVRVLTRADGRRVEDAIRALEPTVPGVTLEVEGGFGRPPLEPTPANRALWELARAEADKLGLPLLEGVAGGGSDGNTTSLYTATLDGLGAVGDGAHSPTEHILLTPTLERTALLAKIMLAEEAP